MDRSQSVEPTYRELVLQTLDMHTEMVALHLFCDRRLPSDLLRVRVSVAVLKELCALPEVQGDDLSVHLHNIRQASAWLGV